MTLAVLLLGVVSATAPSKIEYVLVARSAQLYMHPRPGMALAQTDDAQGWFSARLRRTLPSGWSEIETAPSPDGCHAGTDQVSLRLFVKTEALVEMVRQRVELKLGAARLVFFPGARVGARDEQGLTEVVAAGRRFRVVLPRGVVGTSYVPRPGTSTKRDSDLVVGEPITPSKDWSAKGNPASLVGACAEAHFRTLVPLPTLEADKVVGRARVAGVLPESALLFWPDGSPAGSCTNLVIAPDTLRGPRDRPCFEHDLGGSRARVCLHHSRESTTEQTMQEAINRAAPP